MSDDANEMARQVVHKLLGRVISTASDSFSVVTVADAIDAAVQAERERFQRLIPVLLTWKENQPTEAELAQALDDLQAAGITPEYLVALSNQQERLDCDDRG